VYRYVEACEPWVVGGELLSEIAVVADPAQGDRPGASGLGTIRALQQLRHQFDLLPPSADLSAYAVVIVPESVRIDEALREKLRAHLATGRGLLVSGQAALDEAGQPVMEELGIESHGESPFTATYLRPAPEIGQGPAPMDAVMYERGFRMTPSPGAEALCGVVEPYFERGYEHFCSHRQTPPDRLSPYAAVVQNGRAITFAVPIFTAHGKHGAEPYRRLLRACLDRLLPEPLLRAGGPVHLETTVIRRDGRTVVHLISYCPVRSAESLDLVEDPFPLVEMPLSLRLEEEPRRVFLAPSGEELAFEYRDGRAEVRVTCLDGHTMVVLE